MERQFCEDSEYVFSFQIGPQIKATNPFNWHSPEIALADLNSICNLRLIVANMGIQRLIWVHFQSNIKLKLHFWLEAALWPRGRKHQSMTSRPEGGLKSKIWGLSENWLIGDFGHSHSATHKYLKPNNTNDG